MDRSEFTATQEKIYDDKSKLSDKALLDIINNKEKYVFEVIEISKLILIERGVLQNEVIEKELTETVVEIKTDYRIDGPPYDRKFDGISKLLIFLSFSCGIIYGIGPKNNLAFLIILLVFSLLISLWSATAAARYLKLINREIALAVICFFLPFLGLIAIRYLVYGFRYPEMKTIYEKAVSYYNYKARKIREINERSRSAVDDMLENLANEVNTKLNEKTEEFLKWIGEDEKVFTKEEVTEKMIALVADFEHEEEPLPVIDISFKMDEPEPEDEVDNSSGLECPACGHAISKEDKECPECGISLE